MNSKRYIYHLLLPLFMFLALILSACQDTVQQKPTQPERSSEHATKEADVSLPNESERTIYDTVKELIVSVLQSSEYGDKTEMVAENYVQLMRDVIDTDMYIKPNFKPASAKMIPFHSFIEYSNPPAFSIYVMDREGSGLILSLQEPEYAGSAGTVEVGDRPYSERIRYNVDIPSEEYDRKRDEFISCLTEAGITSKIISEIRNSDWVVDATEAENYARDYVYILSVLYAYDQIEDSPITEIALVVPAEKMLTDAKSTTAPYALKLSDESDNTIVIYLCRASRIEFYSVLYNGALIRFCITRF